jgi:integrase/recombinase XerD
MKTLLINSAHYKYLLQSFAEYIQILGYAATTVQTMPIHVREFLHYLEQRNIQQIQQATPKDIDQFVYYLKHRANKTTKGTALSSSSINKTLNALQLFAKYLNSTGKYTLTLQLERAFNDTSIPNILTITEIKQLYQATFLPNRNNTIATGQRDRAIIAVFYGCGLRKSEGINLNIADIDLQRKLLLVRKGKGNKQRYVPIAAQHVEDIKSYLQEGREWYLHQHAHYFHQEKYGSPYPKKQEVDTEAFFISQHGKRLTCMDSQLKRMLKRAEITTPITLHGLRHSIATHLLQSGMDMEAIAKFLGHSSLISTQIYTHILNEQQNE